MLDAFFRRLNSDARWGFVSAAIVRFDLSNFRHCVLVEGRCGLRTALGDSNQVVPAVRPVSCRI